MQFAEEKLELLSALPLPAATLTELNRRFGALVDEGNISQGESSDRHGILRPCLRFHLDRRKVGLLYQLIDVLNGLPLEVRPRSSNLVNVSAPSARPMTRIGLIDYGMGNLHSVQRAFERLGCEVRILQQAEAMQDCQALVLPGVGAFDPAMERLNASGLVPPSRPGATQGAPCLEFAWVCNCSLRAVMKDQPLALGLLGGHIAALPKVPGHPSLTWDGKP